MSCVPPLVSIFGLFPVLVKCDYELIIVQLCLSHYLWLSCVFIVLSVQFDFVWSTCYSPVFLSVNLALSCPAFSGVFKDCLFELHPRLRVPRSSLVCAYKGYKPKGDWFYFAKVIKLWFFCTCKQTCALRIRPATSSAQNGYDSQQKWEKSVYYVWKMYIFLTKLHGFTTGGLYSGSGAVWGMFY